MKKSVRFVCVLLAASILFAMPVSAVESRSSSFFRSSCVYLYQTSTNSFQAWFEVDALDVMDELGASVIKIQRSSDGENWTTMATYSRSFYPNFICENTGIHASYISYTGTVGYYYRAYIILYAKNSSGFAEWSRYTTTLKL